MTDEVPSVLRKCSNIATSFEGAPYDHVLNANSQTIRTFVTSGTPTISAIALRDICIIGTHIIITC